MTNCDGEVTPSRMTAATHHANTAAPAQLTAATYARQ
jgi:hypothetical protein